MERFEKCKARARNGFGCETEADVERVAKHLYAKELADGATIGKLLDGRAVVHKAQQVKPRLP